MTAGREPGGRHPARRAGREPAEVPARRPATTQPSSRRAGAAPKGRRIGTRLAALSSAAILSIYAAGYLRTQAAEQQALAFDPTPTPGGGVTTSTPATTPTTAAGYRDGTYVGLGKSRHGDIEVTLVVQAGRIASAQITSCRTRYPCSYISGLQGQVVQRQSTHVDRVSGASDSSKAFVSAVTAALAQAT